MKIEGEYSFAAPCQLVWSLLHDPGAIQEAVPGCERFYQLSEGAYRIVLRVPSGPLNGRYEGTVILEEAHPAETFRLSLRGGGSQHTFSGEGSFALSEDRGRTKLHYRGEVEVAGPVANQSPRLIRTAANSLIRRYLEALDRQVGALTGSPGPNGLSPLEALSTERKSTTIGMQDWFAEIRRDRRVPVTLLVLALFAGLSSLGALVIGLLVARWAARASADRLARLAGRRKGHLSGKNT